MRFTARLFAGSAMIVAVLAGCSQTVKVADAPPPPPNFRPAPPPPPPPPPPSSQVKAESEQVSGSVVRNGGNPPGANYVARIAAPSPQASAADVIALENRSRPDAVSPPRYAYIPGVQVPVQPSREQYEGEEVSPVHFAATDPVSTFSVDVDTAAYANARRYLTGGSLPPAASVRTEELINYFRYDYPLPSNRSMPFSVNTDMAVTPWNAETRLLRIGLRGFDLPRDKRPAANLVFLLDVSGSMNSADKLPLVKTAMRQLAGELLPQDKVSIVVYAGAAGVVLQPTNDANQIRRAIDQLSAGGSTAGGAGIQLAYNLARENMIEGGVNRVILATDGDFNVGVSSREALVSMIERERDSGVTLTTLGFGTGNLNDAMMEQLSNHGNGNYAYVDSALEAQKVLSEEMESTLFTIAKDVKIQVEFNPALVSQYRLIGYENRALREQDFSNDAVDAGDIGAGHQVTAIYEVVPAGARGWVSERRYGDRPAPAPEDKYGEIAYVQLRYKLPNEDHSRLIQQPVPASVMQRATKPVGDMAFASAVAAYGQILRGDDLLNGFSFADAAALAGRQRGYWREEFLQLAGLAESLDAR